MLLYLSCVGFGLLTRKGGEPHERDKEGRVWVAYVGKTTCNHPGVCKKVHVNLSVGSAERGPGNEASF